MAKSKTGLIATGIEVLTFLLVIIAFSTPNWLETDYVLEKPKFEKIGLWTVCFTNFRDPHYWYDVEFRNCWWVFEEEFYIIDDILLPGFFVAVQFFFTLCFTLHLIGLGCAGLYMMCSRENTRFVKFIIFYAITLLSAAFSGMIAVIIFGAYGDGRDWMPDWEHNNIGWSYALAVIGVIGSYVSGTLYLIEAKRYYKKKQQAKVYGSYQLEQKSSTHSNI